MTQNSPSYLQSEKAFTYQKAIKLHHSTIRIVGKFPKNVDPEMDPNAYHGDYPLGLLNGFEDDHTYESAYTSYPFYIQYMQDYDLKFTRLAVAYLWRPMETPEWLEAITDGIVQDEQAPVLVGNMSMMAITDYTDHLKVNEDHLRHGNRIGVTEMPHDRRIDTLLIDVTRYHMISITAYRSQNRLLGYRFDFNLRPE